ncbi:MAG: SLC13 family permease [Peptoniphilaceae bacterium]|nr:SLC13 family permease [Peptoniphilaceae bacterium]
MGLAVISILFLALAIFIGFKKGINTGFVSIGLALILGSMGGIKTSEIIKGFNSSLFITMLGVSFMFAIASDNKTLELTAKKLIYLAGNKIFLIPYIVFLISAFLAGIGPGTVPVMGIMSIFAMSLAASMGLNPILLASSALLGAQAGGLTPIAPTGILAQELATQAGIGDLGLHVAMNQFIASLLYFTVIYIVLRGYRMEATGIQQREALPKFNKYQWMTILGIVVMIVAVLIFGYNVGLVCFLLGAILLIFNASTTKAAMKNIAWSTLILVCGVNVLMSVVIKLGGIQLISDALASIMIPFTSVSIIGISSGILSWFSSTSGVVMPTMIPTVPGILESLGGGNAIAMVSAIIITAHTAGCSPISSGGGQSLAAYTTLVQTSETEERDLFKKLFYVAIGGVIFMGLWGLLGGFSFL